MALVLILYGYKVFESVRGCFAKKAGDSGEDACELENYVVEMLVSHA